MNGSAESGFVATWLIVGGVGMVVGIGVYVWYALALSRLFPRIDGEGWKGWVPILNEAEILARGGVPAWSVVFYFIPIVQLYGLYLKVVATHRINKRFGRGAGLTVLAVLLPPVWATVLAWGAPPYPEGERLEALQPGPRRTPPPAAAPARDASGYTIPSLAPHTPSTPEAPALIFPDYAPPAAAPAPSAPAASAPAASAPAAPSSWGAPAAQADAANAKFAPPAPPTSAPRPPQPPVHAPAPPQPTVAPFASAPAPHPPAAPAAAAPPAPPAPPSARPAPPAPPAPPAAQPPTPTSPPAPPQPPVPSPSTPASAPPAAYPQTGIMATMGGDSTPSAPDVVPGPPTPTPFDEGPAFLADPDPAVVVAPVRAPDAPAEQSRVVRPAPPSFREAGAEHPSDAAAAIRPAPSPLFDVPAPAGGLAPDVDKTVVSPRPTDDDLDATVVVARKRGVRRALVLDDGRKFALSGASVVIGRNPTGEAGEQRLAISDTTRTLSKTHARLVVHDDEWRLTDLHATNGVVVVGDDGSETLLDPGESVIGNGRFILGEVGMHVIAERDA